VLPGEVFAVFDCNTSDFSSMLCLPFKCALMLEVEPAQYLKVAKQILQIVLDFSVVPSLVAKPKYFHTAERKEAGGFTIAWSFVAVLSAMFENVTMSTHMVCLVWKFLWGGRGATFLPSNMAQELQSSVFDRLSMNNAHLIEIWILSLQYNDSLRALLERYAKNQTKIETWNQIIVNRTERS